MEAPATQQITVGEAKFRALVQSLFDPAKSQGVEIDCKTSSKARNLRRAFYRWTNNLAEMERNHMAKFTYTVSGRMLSVIPKITWEEQSPEGESRVSNSSGQST